MTTKQNFGLILLLSGLFYGYAQSLEEIARLSKEELLQLKQQLLAEKETIDQQLRLRPEDYLNNPSVRQKVKDHEARPWFPQEAPKVGLAISSALVKIESVRRVDEEVLRAFRNTFPNAWYYELQARVMKVWKVFVEGTRQFKVGDVLPLLWVGCHRANLWEQGKPVPPSWQVGSECLVYQLLPSENRPKDGLGDCWWEVPGTTNCTVRVVGRVHALGLNLFTDDYGILLELGGPYGVESPSEEILALMEEETTVVPFLSDYERRRDWVKARVSDERLPLWKRQRAMLYWFINWWENISGSALQRAVADLSPDASDSPNLLLVHKKRVEFLEWLRGLSSPVLRGYGLQMLSDFSITGPTELSLSRWEREIQLIERFLDSSEPSLVRREAARALMEYTTNGLRPYRPEDKERYIEWRRAWAESLRSRWLAEADEVVRYYLILVWGGNLHHCADYFDSHIRYIEDRLRALERDERKN